MNYTKPWARICAFFFLGILVILGLTVTDLFPEEFKRAIPGRIFSFPRDHFSHPEFKTEWWYYSGHLQSLDSDKKSYGYQLTFFRTALKKETKDAKSKWSIRNLYFAHLALTDELEKTFEYREKISRGSLGEAGASSYEKNEKPFRVWIEDWFVKRKSPGMRHQLLRARNQDLGIEFLLTPEKK